MFKKRANSNTNNSSSNVGVIVNQNNMQILNSGGSPTKLNNGEKGGELDLRKEKKEINLSPKNDMSS